MKFRIFNTESEFNFEIIDLQNYNVLFHKNLIINSPFEQLLLTDNNEAFFIIYPPFFFRKKGNKDIKYYLVARHFTYSFFVSKGITQFPCIVLDDEKLLPDIFNYEKNEILFLEKKSNTPGINSEIKYTSSATKTRHEAKQAGQICPFCGGNLRRSRKKEKSEKGGYKISCENKSNKLINNGKGCDFEFFLTATEFQMFKKYEFPTSIWLQPLSDIKCPKCNGEIYLRTLYKPNNENKVYEICAKRFSRKSECNYLKPLSK